MSRDATAMHKTVKFASSTGRNESCVQLKDAKIKYRNKVYVFVTLTRRRRRDQTVR